MMKLKHIGHVLALLLLTSGLGSCVYEAEDEPDPVPTGGLLSLAIEVPSMRVGAADGTANPPYEAGVDFENYIDLTDRGLRIYLFDAQNKFITRLIPLGGIPTDNTGEKKRYTVTGVLPDDFPPTSTFKVAVLANWPVYTDDLTAGVTTLDDLCRAEWATFSRLTNFELSRDNKIPFFGIHEYAGITVAPGETTVLTEDITLLRAMAKVEVVLDNPNLSLASVAIRGFNAKGFCAPAGVYKQGDYDHNGNWDADYVQDLNLPGDRNDGGQAGNVAPLFCKNRRNGEQRETWVCYVPEYRNTGNGDYKSRLELRFDSQDATEDPYEVFFENYENGQAVAGSDFDIRRNNLYRFTVNLSLSGLIIKVKPWDNAYDNHFIFQ